MMNNKAYIFNVKEISDHTLGMYNHPVFRK